MLTCLGWMLLWPLLLVVKMLELMNPQNRFFKKRPERRDDDWFLFW